MIPKSYDTGRATEFAIFCIENVADRLGVSGAKVFCALADVGGVEGFLYPSYETLHTQGKDYIVDETLDWLREHSPSFSKVPA